MPFSAPKHHPLSRDEAESLSIEALSFLAADANRLARFLYATGLVPADIRSQAASAEFLAGILDFIAADESLLLVFASERGIDPAMVLAAKRSLTPDPGGEF